MPAVLGLDILLILFELVLVNFFQFSFNLSLRHFLAKSFYLLQLKKVT